MISEELKKILALQHDSELQQLRADLAVLKAEMNGRINAQEESVKQVEVYKWVFGTVAAVVAILSFVGFRGVGDLTKSADYATTNANKAVEKVQEKFEEAKKSATSATEKANLAAAQHAETEDVLRSYVFADLVEEFDQVVNQIGSAGSKGEGPARARLTATFNKLQLLQEAFLRHEKKDALPSQDSRMISLLMRFGAQTERTLIYFSKRTDVDEPAYLRDLADQQRAWEELLADQLFANIDPSGVRNPGVKSGDFKITKIAAYVHHQIARLHIFRSRVSKVIWRKEINLAIENEATALRLYSTFGRGLSNAGNFYAERARKTVRETPQEGLERLADAIESDFQSAAGYHQAALAYADGPRDFSVRYNNKAVAAYQWADFHQKLADLADQKKAGSGDKYRASVSSMSKDADDFLDRSQAFGLDTTEFSYTTRAELICLKIAIDKERIAKLSESDRKKEYEDKLKSVIDNFKDAKVHGYVLPKSLPRLIDNAPIIEMLKTYHVPGWEDALKSKLGLE